MVVNEEEMCISDVSPASLMLSEVGQYDKHALSADMNVICK